MEKLGYRPDIDGLRAIAVVAVILYHFGFGWLCWAGPPNSATCRTWWSSSGVFEVPTDSSLRTDETVSTD